MNSVVARRMRMASLSALMALTTVTGAPAQEVRVQDVTRLQGQRTNKLMGYGLVVGLAGTGDGGKHEPTLRALMSIHRKFHHPVLGLDELSSVDNVALVLVEATIPEFGGREGQTLDAVVSAFSAASLRGGQLLTTPLQFALFDENDPNTQQILALAGGRIDIPDPGNPQRGIIRGGCTLEADFFYNFILDGAITLVLDDEHAGFQWAQLVARAVRHELSVLAEEEPVQSPRAARPVVVPNYVDVIGPKNVRVRIPPYELAAPAGFISRVLQTRVFMTPEQPARVCVNRTTNQVSFTGAVTISPTILQLPGLGTLAVGVLQKDTPAGGLDKQKEVAFQELLNTLSKLQLAPQQMVATIEHLHRTGTLHAQLVYTE